MADDSASTLEEEEEDSSIRRTMAKHPELFIFILAMSCTFFSSNSVKKTSPPIYQAQIPPKHFFRTKSIVLDFPFGNLNNVGSLLESEEVLFVMFYAPWCAKSQRLRTEFERAALYMKHQLTFVAINCWYGKGQCRQKNNFQEFPVFFLYFGYVDGYKFSGVPSAENLVQFAEHMLYPIHYLTSEEQLVMFLSQRDNAVISYFDFNTGPQPPGYQQFYYASMRVFEADLSNRVDFGLITHARLAQNFGMNETRTMYYCRALNNTLQYPVTKNFTSSAITKWLLSLRTTPTVKWISVSGMKSLELSSELEQGAALLAFVPEARLLSINQYHSMMREVALHYGNCDDVTKWREMVESSQYARWFSLVTHFSALQRCLKHQSNKEKGTDPETEEKPYIPPKQCCTTLAFRNKSDLGSCDACVNYEPDSALAGKSCSLLSPTSIFPAHWSSSTTASSGSMELTTDFLPQNGCSAMQTTYNPHEFVTFCCAADPNSADWYLSAGNPSRFSIMHHYENSENVESFTDVSHNTSDDPFVLKYSNDGLLDIQCRKLRMQQEHSWLPPIDITDMGFDSSDSQPSVSQLGCDTNRTLRFYTMALQGNEPFLRGLGINVSEGDTKSRVFIIDVQNDFQYEMKETFSKENLAYLISNFTENNLERELRSGIIPPTISSIEKGANNIRAPVNSQKDANKATVTSLNLPHHVSQAVSPPTACNNQSEACIIEVTTQTFQSVVMDPNRPTTLTKHFFVFNFALFGQDVVLLYYAPWCGFCVTFTHVYLSLARYFHSAPNLTFARINGDVNDLPWQYTVDAYPTVMFYPAHRKSDSVAFPEHLQKRLAHLVHFVLRYSTHALKLHSSLQICTRACIESNLQSCVTRLQTLNHQIKHIQLRVTEKEIELTNSYQQGFAENSAKVKSLKTRIEILRMLLKRKYSQDKTTRELHAVLRTSEGNILQQHKLAALLKQYHVHHAQYKRLLQVSSPLNDVMLS